MKRIIHALAVLWSMAKVLKRTGSSPSKSAIHPAEREEASVLATVSNLQDAHRGRHLKNDFILCFLKHIAIKFANKCSFSDIYTVTKGNLRQARNLLYALRSRNSYVIALTILFMCLIAALNAPAQSGAAANTDEIQPLQIGDTIPEELWHLPLQVVNHPEGKDTITLNDYRDKKLIILDFWATWCAPCISSLYKLDSLQLKFGDELAVIPTTYEQADKVTPFFAEKGWSLPTATSETTFRNYFPYQSIPHQVWISKEVIIGKPIPQYLTAVNISEILDGRQPLLLNQPDNLDTVPLDTLFNVTLTKRNPSVAGGIKREIDGITVNNVTVASLFLEAYRDILPFHASRNRLMLDVNTKTRDQVTLLDFNITGHQEHDMAMMERLDQFTYCYSLRLPEAKGPQEVREFMKRNLNDLFLAYLGVEAHIVKREIGCLVLRNVGDTTLLITKGGAPKVSFSDTEGYNLINQPMSRFLANLSYINMDLATPIVDGSDIDVHIDLALQSNLQDIDALNDELGRYGLSLVEEICTLPVLLITDKHSLTLNTDNHD